MGMCSGEDKLIKNGLMFLYVRLNKSTTDTIKSIEDLLHQGADINFPDRNDQNNTLLHIAAHKDEKEIVQFLLKMGAILTYNLDNKTPWHLAKENNTVVSKEIMKIITEHCKNLPPINLDSGSCELQTKSNQNDSIPQDSCETKTITYPKRAGTSGVSGQFYETKLLSLVLHRAIHDKDIEEYYLAANIRDIGDFDDVCFRFKMKEDNKMKHVMCFMQAKHREHTDKARLTVASVTSPSGQFSYRKYYDSFLKIKQKFLTKSKTSDPMFEGEFKDIHCYFILYTPLEENFAKKLTEDKSKQVCSKLHELINTRKEDKKNTRDVFQFNYEKNDIDCLTDFVQKDRIRALGKVFLAFILSNNTKDLMTNDLMQIYYPALAQYVITPINYDPNSLVWKFREEFFDDDNILMITLKETLYKEIVFKHTKKTTYSKDEIKKIIQDIALKPSVQTITMLLGEVIVFDDKTDKLCLNIDKIPVKKFKSEDIRELNHDLQKINVTLKMVNDATDIIGKEKLTALTFPLPHTFDYSDFPSYLKTEKLLIERLDFIAHKFYLLIEEKKKKLENEIENHSVKEIKYPIIIDVNNENVGPKKILELSHLNSRGIGGTVGNLLQFDTQSQLFLFNTDEKSLKKNAKYMLGKIKNMTNNDDLTKYKINVQMNNFPRMSFRANQNDINDAEDYFCKLWFYTHQAKEEGVENILKEEIKARHYNADEHQNQFMFRVHSDAIFLRFHDEIQKWWKLQTVARYLTKADTIFDEAKKDIIDSPVLTVLNVMFIRTLKKYDVEFSFDVIQSMNLDKLMESKKILNIVTDVVILSAVKIMQIIQSQTNYTNNKKGKHNYTFINLDYVHMLPKNEHSKMMDELKDMSEVMQKEGCPEKERLVIISETSIDEQLHNTLNRIFLIFSGRIIVITDKPLQVESENNDQSFNFHEYKDERMNLNDLNVKCQKKILDIFKISYQGKEVTLNTLIDEDSKYLIRPKILWAILNKNKLEVGQALSSKKYDEIKDYYINRNLFREEEEIVVNTFNDIKERIVLITSKPCMGKTILLTHLSLETKKIDPQPWIVRINMSAHSKDFAKWPEQNIHITKIMRLLCKAAVKRTDELQNLDFTEVTDETVDVNNENLENISSEIKWFIHFYNSGKVIFLFDGFDRIYPQHTRQGIELFMALKRANKQMWITSNCYVIKILENKFNIRSYKLDKMSVIQQESFLKKFWETNLKLEKLNHEQYNNINLFFNFISKTFNSKSDLCAGERPMIPLLSIPLHIIYLSAVEYFKNEINNLSPSFLRETIKQKSGLNSFTAVDRYLRRPDEEESMELAGTPLHMYVAANYFEIQIKDKFDLHLNKEEILGKSKVYLNTILTYERFLKINMKHICEIENKNIERSQEQQRDSFFENHKKLALYAICKESDISKLLTDREIREVKRIIRRIESGEIKSPLIDCVVDGIPRFYNFLFAEYFLVEFAADLIKRVDNRNVENIQLESLWDFVVNGIILLSPPGVRNAFDYKLKYDPELIEIASNENCDKVIFDLIVKQNIRAEIGGRDSESSINVAINDGLVNVTNLLLKSARRHVNSDNLDGFLSVFKSGAFMLGSVNSSWKELTDKVLRCISDVDGEKLLRILHSDLLVSQTLSGLYSTTEIGKTLHQKVKDDVCEPIKKLADDLVTFSNNENLTTLAELLPYYLPDIVDSLFGKK